MTMTDIQEPVPAVLATMEMQIDSASGGKPVESSGYQLNPNPSEPHPLPESINVTLLRNSTPQTSSQDTGY